MVLLDGLNDSADHALGLVEFCRGLRVEVNVIPYNEANLVMPSGGLRAPDLEVQNTFVRILRQHGIFTTLRKSLGGSISAACGQLVATRDSVPHG
jgi:23S rRNA (adenine2503-C2)-methyltransferase